MAGAWDCEERLIERFRLANGLLRHFAPLLDCPDTESLLNYIQDMGIGANGGVYIVSAHGIVNTINSNYSTMPKNQVL